MFFSFSRRKSKDERRTWLSFLYDGEPYLMEVRLPRNVSAQDYIEWQRQREHVSNCALALVLWVGLNFLLAFVVLVGFVPLDDVETNKLLVVWLTIALVTGMAAPVVARSKILWVSWLIVTVAFAALCAAIV